MTTVCPKYQHENLDDIVYCGKCTTPLKPSEKEPIGHTETLHPSLIKNYFILLIVEKV